MNPSPAPTPSSSRHARDGAPGPATVRAPGTVMREGLTLGSVLGARVASGDKCFVPYLTGGYPDWERSIVAAVAAGADAVEIGIPFSDPVMDGPVIQRSSDVALRAGTTPAGVVDATGSIEVAVPLAVMTYANLVFRYGYERFAASLRASGISGAILPDIPLEEAGPWCEAADAAGVETVMLAAPTADDERLAAVADRARGFVYAVGLLGITGERESLAATAKVIAGRLKVLTDKPVLVGVGVSTPAQAVEVCEVADGVIVGSAIVRRIMESGSVDAGAELISEFVEALRRG